MKNFVESEVMNKLQDTLDNAEIMNQLQDAVDQIFCAEQKKAGIEYGDVSPEKDYELDKALRNMAELVVSILKEQEEYNK